MSGVNRVWFKEPEDLKITINKVCDYLERCDEEVYIVNRRINGKEEDGNFYHEISIDELRKMEEIVGVVDIKSKEYSISLTSLTCSYFVKER